MAKDAIDSRKYKKVKAGNIIEWIDHDDGRVWQREVVTRVINKSLGLVEYVVLYSTDDIVDGEKFTMFLSGANAPYRIVRSKLCELIYG